MVKMQVVGGYADLRGVRGGSRAVVAVGETAWEDAANRCSVHALNWSQYRLNAGWQKD
jgi:hypothetical protein